MHFIKIASSHSLRFISLKFDLKHVMVIRKIGIVNVQLVKGNFATRKQYHLKLSTRRKQLAPRKLKLLKFSIHKTQLATRKIISLNLQFLRKATRISQIATYNL